LTNFHKIDIFQSEIHRGGDQNISSFSAMEKDQTPLFYASNKGARLALIWVPLQRPGEDFRAGKGFRFGPWPKDGNGRVKERRKTYVSQKR
jgi:hypothetical protein